MGSEEGENAGYRNMESSSSLTNWIPAASRSGVVVPHILVISPLPIDFCLRDAQPENPANLVSSDTQGS